jgi:hypothetical protein
MDGGGLASELAGLSRLDHEALLAKWRIVYGTEPPYRIRNNFLIRAIAYRLQEQALGGLKPATRRHLEKLLQENREGQKISMPVVSIKPGARLIREWHGVTHEVVMTEEGILFKGKRYKSLSEVACEITGAKWSGPRFFGLKER